MTTFVLCHGAWGGGWSYRRVAKHLRDAGHEVFTPTYTGLGERSHLANPDISLSTHVADVRGVIRYEELDGFVLVGHSYGGMVITGVAEAEWQKIIRIVYLDAFLPKPGQSLVDQTPDGGKGALKVVAEQGDGWRMPRPPNSIHETVPDDDRAWILRNTCDQPVKTMTEAYEGAENHLKIADKIYVLCTLRTETPFFPIAERLRGDPAWRVEELPTHHHLAMSMPKETAEIISSAISA